MIKRRKHLIFGALCASFTLGAGFPFLVGTASAGGPGPLAFVVNTLDDNEDASLDETCGEDFGDQCSLREAVETLDAYDGGTITFSVDGTFVLDDDIFVAGGDDISITGNGVDKTVVSADDNDRHFQIDDGTALSVAQLTLRDGANEDGGSIRVDPSARLNVDAVHFLDNEAFLGGAISAGGNNRTVDITNSTFAGNSAVAGGAIAVSNDTVTIANSTFTANEAGTGAAIIAQEGVADVTIEYSTFSQNTITDVEPAIRRGQTPQPRGGGVIAVIDESKGDEEVNFVRRPSGGQVEGTFTISNSILEKTTSGGADIDECVGFPTSGGANIVDDTSCGFGQPLDLQDTASNVGALGDNGGPTFTMALAADSAAVDVTPTCTIADQRGEARATDGDGDGTAGCDSGAYELAAPVQPDPEPEEEEEDDVSDTNTAPPATPTVTRPTFTG